MKHWQPTNQRDALDYSSLSPASLASALEKQGLSGIIVFEAWMRGEWMRRFLGFNHAVRW